MGDGIFLDGLLPFLTELNEADESYVLVGGLAVGKWAEKLLSEQDKQLFDLPILSKDIDIRGRKVEGRLLFQAFRASKFEANSWASAKRKNAPEMGFIYTFDVHGEGKRFSVETLERLPLLDNSLELNGSRIEVDGIYLLDPISLLVCKIHAFNTRPPEHVHNDEKHIEILRRVIPNFLKHIPEGYDPSKDIHGLLKVLSDPLWRTPLPAAAVDSLTSALEESLSPSP